MMIIRILFLVFLSVSVLNLSAETPKSSKKELKTPPRIIRTCCAFGYDLNLAGIPFKKLTHITSIDQLGEHTYLGSKNEGNGLIYTKRGGFIDIGHLRDQSDWMKYIFTLIQENGDVAEIYRKLGYEGGSKTLMIKTQADIDSADFILLAGKIAFDLSLWHELSTWFGASYVPMMPERYSSFSVEDVYSNLLGVLIGIEALKSDLPYDEAMTKILYQTLVDLEAVNDEQGTYDALEVVRDVWWTAEKRLPNKDVLIQRDTEVHTIVRPWIVPDSNLASEPYILEVPKRTSEGAPLNDYYTLNIDLNYKFPVKEIFPERESRVISQQDLDAMLQRVAYELCEQGYHCTELSNVNSTQNNTQLIQ